MQPPHLVRVRSLQEVQAWLQLVHSHRDSSGKVPVGQRFAGKQVLLKRKVLVLHDRHSVGALSVQVLQFWHGMH